MSVSSGVTVYGIDVYYRLYVARLKFPLMMALIVPKHVGI